MTAQKLKQIARTPVPGWMLIAGAMLPLAAAVGGAARYVQQSADERYVTRAGYELDRRTDSLSVLLAAKALQNHTDSTVRELKSCIRHPEDCR